MRLFAKPGHHLSKQLLGDFGILAWCALWAIMAFVVHRLVSAATKPVQKIGDTATKMSQTMVDTGETMSSLPLVGDQMQKPFNNLSAEFTSMADSAFQTVTVIEIIAIVLAVVVFLVPVIYVIHQWLPGRVKFVQQSTAAQQLLASPDSLDLLALRGLANLPMNDLKRISGNPVKAWRDNDRDVIRQLAAIELDSVGLGLPQELETVSASKDNRDPVSPATGKQLKPAADSKPVDKKETTSKAKAAKEKE